MVTFAIFAVPLGAIATLIEFSMVDRTLFWRLCKSFEFIYVLGLGLFLYIPYNIVISNAVEATDGEHVFAGVCVFFIPVVVLWVIVNDAAQERQPAHTAAIIAVFLVAFFTDHILYYSDSGSTFTQTPLCFLDRCTSYSDTFTQPSRLQLMLWLTKYIICLLRSKVSKSKSKVCLILSDTLEQVDVNRSREKQATKYRMEMESLEKDAGPDPV